jgi:flagellar basal-body rod modification protein FlgD
MSDVTSIGSSTSSAAALAERIPTQQLGQDDFLKLLVAQLSSQDPLDPQKDTEFVSQMAQFSSLQNSKDMQSEMESLRANQLIGHTVTVKLDEDVSTVGVVSGVSMDKGKPQIMLNNGNLYDLSDVTLVQQTFSGPAVAN